MELNPRRFVPYSPGRDIVRRAGDLTDFHQAMSRPYYLINVTERAGVWG